MGCSSVEEHLIDMKKVPHSVSGTSTQNDHTVHDAKSLGNMLPATIVNADPGGPVVCFSIFNIFTSLGYLGIESVL